MDFKPNDFFIGLAEFITILLPGVAMALIILLVETNYPMQVDQALYKYAFCDDTKIIFWVAIIFSSFGLGYFLSSIASGLDLAYDIIRGQFCPYEEELILKFNRPCLSEEKKTKYLKIYELSLEKRRENECAKDDIISTLTEEEKLFEGYKIKFTKNYFRKVLAFIFNLHFSVKIDGSYEEARKILDTQPEAVRNATNTYKWAGTILEAHYPSISEEVTRIMSASKFFRSIVLVSLIFLALQLSRQISFSFWEINCLVLILSFREYVVQRLKSVQKTNQSIVTLSYFKKETTEINQGSV